MSANENDPSDPVWLELGEDKRPDYDRLWDWYKSAYRSSQHWHTRAAYLVRLIDAARERTTDEQTAEMLREENIYGLTFEPRGLLSDGPSIVAHTRDGRTIRVG